MAIRADSYSSTAEVKAFTRHLLDGQTAVNSTTLPTATELEKFIDRASSALNVALEANGFSSPITSTANSTASLLCDDWVTARAVEYVELTHPGRGYSAEEGTRTGGFAGLHKEAQIFVSENSLGFRNIGVTQQNKLSDGLSFTGLDVHSERTDPDDTDTIEQPLFRRRKFDIYSDEDDDS